MVYRPDALPIGVFDSGVGGLTVLAALRDRLPAESFVYLGDTARLPYGTKSEQTVIRYAVGAAEVLVECGIKLLVVACNTASAVALPALHQAFAPLPVLGVIEPGAEAAAAASATGRIIVTGTEGTIRQGAYDRAILRRRPGAVVTGIACPVFVALAEEGWVDGPVVELAVRRYLEDAVESAAAPDTIVLGCTHFPVLTAAIAHVAGPAITIVDSAQTTARAVAQALAETGLATSHRGEPLRLLATDGPERFARVGSRFLAMPLAPEQVELVDL